ncbi:MAG: T9SS type A sorting domain-containing protein, partial [Bacteroidales bacterium]|nr:T9SS type A sorting domain-containing protein [Bacteroidales bacterium]
SEATIADLLELVNHALGGGDITPLSLSHVAGAANLVNEAFDECVVILDQETAEAVAEGVEGGEEASKKGITGIADLHGSQLGIYPNPVSDRFFFTLPSGTNHISSAVIYNISGLPVRHLVLDSDPGNENTWEVGVDHLMPGIYIMKLETEAGSYSQRFGVQ